MINNNDFLVLIGLYNNFIGAWFLASGAIFKNIEKIPEEAKSYIGFNPYLIRSFIKQKYEAVTGAAFLVIGFSLQTLGITGFLNLYFPFFNLSSKMSWLLLFLPIFAVFIIFTIGYLSENNFLKIYAPHGKELFEKKKFILDNNGKFKNEVDKDIQIDDEMAQKRIKGAIETLTNLENILGKKVSANETLENRLHNLSAFLNKYTSK